MLRQVYGQGVFSLRTSEQSVTGYVTLAAGSLRSSSGGRLHYSTPWWLQVVPRPSNTDVCPLVDVLWHQKGLYAPLQDAGWFSPTDQPVSEINTQ